MPEIEQHAASVAAEFHAMYLDRGGSELVFPLADMTNIAHQALHAIGTRDLEPVDPEETTHSIIREAYEMDSEVPFDIAAGDELAMFLSAQMIDHLDTWAVEAGLTVDELTLAGVTHG